MFRSPSGRKPARAARRIALVVSLLAVAAGIPYVNSAGAWQQDEEVRPRLKSVVKGQANIVEGADFVPGEVLVRFRTETAAKTAESALRADDDDGQVSVERFGGSEMVKGLRLAKVDPARTLEAVAELANRDDVLYAEPNYIWRTSRTPNDPCFNSVAPCPVLNGMYGLNKIGAPAAWDTTVGSRSVVVGVLDGGVDVNHDDLRANIWTNPNDPAGDANGDGNPDDDGNGFVDDIHGWDFHNNNSSVFDNESSDAHATHVAGTIGAHGDNSLGVTGVNWEVSIVSIKVLGPGSGSVSNIIKGYNYALDLRTRRGVNLRVLNNSYGGAGKSLAALDAINQLNNAGILFVAAAGNDARDNFSYPAFPANYDTPNVIAVASTTSSDALSGFSNFGARLVSIGAPGSSILSTVPNNSYATYSGTSMATPHVA
ncbi:MAG TPA: S8 family peptidase, partial [Pyrinomonadaceae bacterium]|nr:S8 family peptidase [Pyrinomonadaceae bacterium]